jgi:hypothetical protein
MRSDRLSTSRLVTALFAATALLAACGGEPATGQCTGAVGSTLLDAPIDADSNFHRIARRTCTGLDRMAFEWRYGGGALHIRAETQRALTVFDPEGTYPIPPSPGASFIEKWEIKAPESAPQVSGGSVRLKYRSGHRVSGTFEVSHADGTRLTCEFDLPEGVDEGAEPNCPGLDFPDD